MRPSTPTADAVPESRRRAHLWTIKSHWVVLMLAFWFALPLNIAFWGDIAAILRDTPAAAGQRSVWPIGIGAPIAIYLVYVFVFAWLVWPYAGKAIGAVLLVASAAASFYMVRLGVHFDRAMMGNILGSDFREAMETISPGLIGWTVLWGAIPAALLAATRIRYAPLRIELLRRAGAALGALLAVGVMGAVFLYQPAAMIARNNQPLGSRLNPISWLVNTVRHVRRTMVRPPSGEMEKPFLSEELPDLDDPHTVFVLVVGETARAANYSLGGYARETNPRMAREDIVYFSQVSASATYTRFSLPCLFSRFGRRDFRLDQFPFHENLLDLLQKGNYEVVWRGNQAGHFGVADRLDPRRVMFTRDFASPRHAAGGVYYDEALLEGLEEQIARSSGDTVIVLHLLGSHGPSYHLRYPPDFKVFTPASESADIQAADRGTIVNTYDNTILYTDHVLAEVVDILKKFPHLETGMLYVSDHGESLGERGLYLHGLPYALAPREQLHVPMILWMSEVMKKCDFIDWEELRASRHRPLTHDHIFHSLLALLEIRTEWYDPALDLFADCRTGGYAHPVAGGGETPLD